MRSSSDSESNPPTLSVQIGLWARERHPCTVDGVEQPVGFEAIKHPRLEYKQDIRAHWLRMTGQPHLRTLGDAESNFRSWEFGLFVHTNDVEYA